MAALGACAVACGGSDDDDDSSNGVPGGTATSGKGANTSSGASTGKGGASSSGGTSATNCDPATAAMGDNTCPEYVECAQTECASQYQECLGAGYESGDFSGGACET